MAEIGENGILRKKTSNRFHRFKNRRIWTWFHGEIEIRSGEKISGEENHDFRWNSMKLKSKS